MNVYIKKIVFIAVMGVSLWGNSPHYIMNLDETIRVSPENEEEIAKIEFMKKAARAGIASAALFVGVSYWQGEVVGQDYKQAYIWLKMAAERGDADSQELLGHLYNKGWGIPTSYEEGVLWSRRAAMQGAGKAQVAMAVAYGLGRGVKQNFTEGYIWASLAVANGAEQAIEVRDMSEKNVPPVVLRQAQKKAIQLAIQIQKNKEQSIVRKNKDMLALESLIKKQAR